MDGTEETQLLKCSPQTQGPLYFSLRTAHQCLEGPDTCPDPPPDLIEASWEGLLWLHPQKGIIFKEIS